MILGEEYSVYYKKKRCNPRKIDKKDKCNPIKGNDMGDNSNDIGRRVFSVL